MRETDEYDLIPRDMNTTPLQQDLLDATTTLCNALAQSPQIIAAKARIGLFFQNPDATKLFEEVNAYGEELRSKHLAGMPPTEEEIEKFDKLRASVIENELARGFLEARQSVDALLATINQYLGMSIDMGRAPTPEEVEESAKRAASASCSCGGDCDGDCSCGGDCQCEGEGHEHGDDCCCKH